VYGKSSNSRKPSTPQVALEGVGAGVGTTEDDITADKLTAGADELATGILELATMELEIMEAKELDKLTAAPQSRAEKK
jgi:hypothetical protein